MASEKQHIKIMLYGDFTWDRLAVSYQKAFEQLGNQVVKIDIREISNYLAPWLRNRVGHRLTIKSLELRRLGSKRWNEFLTNAAREEDPQLLFILNGDFLMPETIKAFKRLGIPVFIFHADNPFPPFPNTRPETLQCAQ